MPQAYFMPSLFNQKIDLTPNCFKSMDLILKSAHILLNAGPMNRCHIFGASQSPVQSLFKGCNILNFALNSPWFYVHG